MGGGDYSPDIFLEKQTKDWGRYWAPDPGGAQCNNVASELNDFRTYALQFPHEELTPFKFVMALKNYNKDTKGGDAWT